MLGLGMLAIPRARPNCVHVVPSADQEPVRNEPSLTSLSQIPSTFAFAGSGPERSRVSSNTAPPAMFWPSSARQPTPGMSISTSFAKSSSSWCTIRPACSYSSPWGSVTLVTASQAPDGAGCMIRFFALVVSPNMSPSSASISSLPPCTRYSFWSSRTRSDQRQTSSAVPSNSSSPPPAAASVSEKKSNVAGVPTPLNAEMPIVAPASASSGCVRPTGVHEAPSGEYAAVTFVPSDRIRRNIVSVVR